MVGVLLRAGIAGQQSIPPIDGYTLVPLAALCWDLRLRNSHRHLVWTIIVGRMSAQGANGNESNALWHRSDLGRLPTRFHKPCHDAVEEWAGASGT
jgi:hypothetical protein